MKKKPSESTIATIGGLLTSLGVVWAVFIDHDIHIGLKLIIASLPAIGGVLTKNFNR